MAKTRRSSDSYEDDNFIATLPRQHATRSEDSSKKKADTRSKPESRSPPAWSHEELQSLRSAVCRSIPSANDVFWRSKKVWVGCTEVRPHDGYEPNSLLMNLEIRITATSLGDSGKLWEYYASRDKELQKVVKQCATGNRIKILDVRFIQGSVEILLVIAVIKAAVSAAGIILGIMAALANYDKTKAGFNDAKADCKAFVEKLVYRIRAFFEGFGHGPAPASS
jgi:hypothetical protein